MMKTYYMLTKPGIIMENALTMAAGFILASKGHFHLSLFLVTLVGLSLVIASAGVFNNYLDRESDAKMSRTKNRPLVKKLISDERALIFGTLLGIFGFVILLLFTNLLATLIAFAGFVTYVLLYGFYKYRTIHGTLIGSLSGAVPPLLGYCAAGNRLDGGGLILFLILVLWQMPHFFAIALYRLPDYTAASIPVLPVKKGAQETKIQSLIYIVAFLAAATSLTLFNYTGYAYLLAVILLSLVWLGLCLRGFFITNDQKWGHQMFVYSLVTITVLCLMICVDFRPGVQLHPRPVAFEISIRSLSS